MLAANKGKVITIVLAVLTALGAHLGAFPWLPIWLQHTLELLAFIASVVTAVLMDPKASAERALVVALCVLGAGAFTASCASFRAKPPIEQARLELAAAEWGVKADHDFGTNWLSDADVAVFNHIDDTLRQVIDSNPPNLYAALATAADIEDQKLPADSKLHPYVQAFALYMKAKANG